MKRHQYFIIPVLLLVLIGAVALTMVYAGPLLGSGAPTVVSYQGVVKDSGTPYTGTGYFKFAVVNATGDTSYWSNDGTSSGGGEPTDGVSLTVDEGLFQVLLGDTGLTNMTSLSASVFSGTERYLRVWFSTDDITYTLLSPDQQFAAVPYALQAQEAAVAESLSSMGSGSGLDADLLDGQEGAAYQDRVSGNCDLGSTIRGINANGSVVCEPHDTRPVFSRITLDSTGNVGKYTSITIGTDGLPVISYYDMSNGDLKVAHCSDTACTSVSTTILDSTGDIGWYTSITIGADGLPVISYWDGSNYDLKVAHCNDIACTSASITTLDSIGNVGHHTSITKLLRWQQRRPESGPLQRCLLHQRQHHYS